MMVLIIERSDWLIKSRAFCPVVKSGESDKKNLTEAGSLQGKFLPQKMPSTSRTIAAKSVLASMHKIQSTLFMPCAALRA